MKRLYLLLGLLFIGTVTHAQEQVERRRPHMEANPRAVAPKMVAERGSTLQLTTEQWEAINKLRVEMQQELLPVENELRERRAELLTLKQVDDPNIKKINKKIDEVTSLENKRMKRMALYQRDVRALLTPEQRLNFDKRGGFLDGRGGFYGRRGAFQRGRGVGAGRGVGVGAGRGVYQR